MLLYLRNLNNRPNLNIWPKTANDVHVAAMGDGSVLTNDEKSSEDSIPDAICCVGVAIPHL